MDWNTKKYNNPFDHWILNDFFSSEFAAEISNSFCDYNDSSWWNYNSPLENKKTIQDWRKFSPIIYRTFQHLCSPDFIGYLKEITGIRDLYPDYGLHGGGLHIHGTGGNLNIHKDYSIHPKVKLQRKLNLIIYMTPDWDNSWGGGLEFWSHNSETNKPQQLIKTIDCSYNKAVLFDTTQNSWHGLPSPLQCPEGIYRKSLAVYYLTTPDESAEDRSRALFVPREDQDTLEIRDLCMKRSIDKNNETEKEYWKQFYEKNKNLNNIPSNFCIFVDEYFKNAAKDLFVLDAGCGNGRDSYFLSKRYNVRGIDISVIPESNENVSFLLGDFCSVDKNPYDIIYSRFTFHSISNEQHLEFFESIKKSGTYLCIETRSDLDIHNHRYHGNDHYRNFTNSAYLKELLKKYNFDILYFEEDKNFAKYKNENPICIRTICIKR